MPISPGGIFATTLPVFALVVFGMILRWRGKLDPASDKTILFLTVTITYPAYILHKILGDPALHDYRNIFLPALCGAGFMLIGMAASWIVAPWFGLKERRSRGSFALACSVQNYGYIPIPILMVLFPDHSWAGVLFIYTLGIEVVIWTIGIMLVSGSGKGGAKQLLNPVVVSIPLGVALNLLNVDPLIPSWVSRFLEMLGDCTFPLGLLMFGTALADLTKAPGWHKNWKTPVGAILMRLILLPITMIVLTSMLTQSIPFRQVIAVQAAMPAAMFPLVMAKRYGGDDATAMRVILFTTIVSLGSIPFVAQWALKWLGAG